MPPGFSLLPFVDNVAFWAANDLRRTPRADSMIAVSRFKRQTMPAAA